MMKKLLISITFILINNSFANTMGIAIEPFFQLVKHPNSTYMVNKVYDLMGETFIMPENCMLVFGKKGKIVNGELVGQETKIQCVKEALGVRVSGTWNVKEIKDEWFDDAIVEDVDILTSINNMQSDEIKQVITMMKPEYVFQIMKEGGCGLVLSSNTELYLNTKLKLLTNNLRSYQIINVSKKRNVHISGGLIDGDMLEHSDSCEVKGNWGMGVYISMSDNVSIEDLMIIHCWGDGIYLGGGREDSIGLYENANCKVALRNVVTDDNRRIGLTILHVDGLTVENCKFINTGKSKSTHPAAGVDIEPNVSKGRNQACRNILFRNCELSGCVGNALGSYNSVTENGISNNENIVFESCVISGEAGICLNDVTFIESKLEDIRLLVYSSSVNVKMLRCDVKPNKFRYQKQPRMKGSIGKLNFKMENCNIDFRHFATDNFDIKPSAFESISFVDCNFIVPNSKRTFFEQMKRKIRKNIQNMNVIYVD